LEKKEKWDSDFAMRKKIKASLDSLIPDLSVGIGGATSVDITESGIDRAYGISKLRGILGIPFQELWRLGIVMESGRGNPAELEGIPDPAQRLGLTVRDLIALL
jgi:hypothetical protein